jgi:hypothetical protein
LCLKKEQETISRKEREEGLIIFMIEDYESDLSVPSLRTYVARYERHVSEEVLQ